MLVPLWTNIPPAEERHIPGTSFLLQLLRSFQGSSVCGTVSFLSLSCSIFLTASALLLYHLPIHYFTFTGVILLQKKHHLIQNPGRLYGLKKQQYRVLSVQPNGSFHLAGEVLLHAFTQDSFESVHFLAPPIRGGVAREGTHSCLQVPLPRTRTARSPSEKTVAPLSHQDCLSLS